MSMTTALLIPVFVQIGLTFALLSMLGPARLEALRRGDVKLEDISLGEKAWPPRVTQIANAHDNQYQLPVLLYALVLLALVLHKVDLPLVAGAWIFVLSRFAHAYVYVTTNHVPSRFRTYIAGLLALAAMWLWLGARILIEGA
jgi:hypothetical protein